MTVSVKVVNLAIIGTGTVGSELINQVNNFNIAAKHHIHFKVVSIVKSKFTANLSNSPEALDGLNLTNWKQLFEKDHDNLTESSIEKTADFLQTIEGCKILVDCTSDIKIAEYYPYILKRGINIATPNKKAFSSRFKLYKLIKEAELLGNSSVFHEATVGAGLPIISTLNDIIDTGDKVHRIEGVFSGTLSFLFNQWDPIVPQDKSFKFSEIVRLAKDAGYTEPDPRDDLNGMDVARKVMILARICGMKLDNPGIDFDVQSLLPENSQNCETVEQFLQLLEDNDHVMDNSRAEASSKQKYLRYLGKLDIQNQTASVKLTEIDATHPTASLTGSDNMIAFYTERYQTAPLVIKGSGAGASVTAAGVLSDMIKIAKQA